MPEPGGAGRASTPEERLRKKTQELEQRRQDRQEAAEELAAAAKRDAAKLPQRVRHVGQEYLKRTSTLIAVTRQRVHHAVHYADTGRGFTLEIGRWPALQANWDANAWHVAIRSRLSLVERHTYDSDQTFLAATDSLLEDLVAAAAEALISGRESPAEGR